MQTMQAVTTVDVPESLREPLAAFFADAPDWRAPAVPEAEDHGARHMQEWSLVTGRDVSEGRLCLRDDYLPNGNAHDSYAGFVAGELWQFAMRAAHDGALLLAAGLLTLLADMEGATR